MLTKALAVVGTAALTTSLLGPSVASTHDASPTRTAPAIARSSDGDNLRARWVRDRSRDHRDEDHNAQGFWVFPRHDRGWLYVRVAGQTLRPGRKFNGVELYLQTRGARRPDYRIVHNLPRDGDGLSGTYIKRIRGWNSPGRTRRCPRLSAKWRPGADGVEFDIPRRCIHRQGRVRVNALAWNYTRYRPSGAPRDGVADDVPGSRRLSRWI